MQNALTDRGHRLVLVMAVLTTGFAVGPVALAQSTSARSNENWVGTWGASPSDPLPEATTPTPSYNNQTLREIAHLSLGGREIRLRLTNSLGRQTLTIGAVNVAVSVSNDAIAPGTNRAVTFSGQSTISIPPGALAISDPVDLSVAPLSNLAVSIYVPQNTGPATQHSLGTQTSYVVNGNVVGARRLESPATIQTRPFLSAIEVAGNAQSVAVVTLGDSITDGFRSTVDANRRWPDEFARRLQARFGNRVGVVNEGISGNRVLNEVAGPNAQERFDRDVLAQAGVKYVTLLEGINDIGFSQLPAYANQNVSAEQIIAGYRQIIERAHDKDLIIYGGTLTPFLGAGYADAAGEQKRQTINDFIRNSGAFDGVLDFDLAIRDPADPTRMLPAYDSGDHLHPNDLGYEAMAYSINLSLFRPDRR